MSALTIKWFPWSQYKGGFAGPNYSARAAVMVGLVLRRWLAAVVLGVGWDQDHPLRPWPWVTLSRSEAGRNMLCVSMCGLFVTIYLGALP